jgi:hypothetical protein
MRMLQDWLTFIKEKEARDPLSLSFTRVTVRRGSQHAAAGLRKREKRDALPDLDKPIL